MRLNSVLFPAFAATISLAVGFFGHRLFESTHQSLNQDLMVELMLSEARSSPSLSHPAASAAISDHAAPSPVSDPAAPSPQPSPAPALPSTLAAQLMALKRGQFPPGRSLRILQIGDSHTAGDFFTEQLRSKLQADFGNSGIGWILPGHVPGQSAARYDVRSYGAWTYYTGRGASPSRSTPLGGFVNTGSAGSSMVVRPLARGVGRWRFHALVRSAAAGGGSVRLQGGGRQTGSVPISAVWQAVDLITDAPLAPEYSLKVSSGRVEVAGFWLENDQAGVVVDHVGRNGATLYAFNRWSDDSIARQLAIRPVDAILLAYGTNEAVDRITDREYALQLIRVIRRLKQASPNTAVIVLTAPSFAKGRHSSCQAWLPLSLKAVVSAQSMATHIPGVQVWNWMEAMGGECGVATWARQGLMASDWIHFTPAGYRRSADLLMDWLQSQIRRIP